MRLTLPFPPSTNSLWRAVKGRNIKSKSYRAWEERAGWELKQQLHSDAPIPGPVHLAFVFGRPDKRKRDLDNLLKAPIDLLVFQGVIDDDRNVQSITANWGTGEGIEVVVRAAA